MDFGFILAPIFLAMVTVVLVVAVFVVRAQTKRFNVPLLITTVAVIALGTFMTLNMVRVFREEALYISAASGDTENVRHELARGTDPESHWETGETALQAAESGGHKEVVKLLKEAGARR